MTRTIAWRESRFVDDARGFRAARDFLITRFDDPSAASEFRWPGAERFNWALHWFDAFAIGNDTEALAGPYLHGDWAEFSYDTVSFVSDGVADELTRRGVRPGARIVVEAPNTCELWAVVLGVLKCDAVCIPIHFGLHSEAREARLRAVAPDLVISSSPPLPATPTIGVDELVDWTSRIEFLPAARGAGNDNTVDAPAFGCFTSGTTGTPKLVLHSHRTHGIAHLSSVYWAQLPAGRRHLNVSSPGWAKFFWSSFLVPFTSGATVIVWPAQDPTVDLYHHIERSGSESVCAPTVALRRIDTSRARPATLSDLTSVGEWVDDRLRTSFLKDWQIRIREGFGQSEATAILGELPDRPGRLHVLPGYAVRLHSAADAPADLLQFRSLPGGSFLGYERDGALTPPAIVDGWQWTGDFARGSVSAGTLTLLGRGDDVYRANGHLVSPFAIEAVLDGHPLVAESAVTSVPDDAEGRATHAYVVPADEALSDDELRDIRLWLNARLDPETSVRRVHGAPALPRSVNGKIQRSMLPRPHDERSPEHAKPGKERVSSSQ